MTDDITELYGTMPDVRVGIIVSQTSQAVGKRRRALGIAAYSPRRRIDWSAWDSRLGATTDSHIARLIGCDQTTVRTRRYKLGIPRYRRIDWHKWDSLLNTDSDAALAHRIGCHQSTVTRRRLERKGKIS